MLETVSPTTPPTTLPPDVPSVLLTRPRVIHGDDPGGYYCEHVFYTAQQTAAHSAVRCNGWGEALIGFLHVPGRRDGWLGADSPRHGQPVDPARRHAGTRRVVGRALAGFCTTLMADPPDLDSPLRILLTGFGPFAAVVDNPTGDFVSDDTNLDAAMGVAFGRRLLTPAGSRQALDASGHAASGAPVIRQYRTRRSDGTMQTVWLGTVCLATDDTAVAADHPSSLVTAMTGPFQPHAVLSLGVARSAKTFWVEHKAGDRNLTVGRHVEAVANHHLPSNFALARAIVAGRAGSRPVSG